MALSAFLLLAAAAQAAAAPSAPQPPIAAVCPRFGEKPQGCVEPPLLDAIRIWGAWSPPDALDPRIVRAPMMHRAESGALPRDRFPAALRQGSAGGSAEVRLRLIIAADGAITDCRATGHEAWLANPGAKRIDLKPDPALAAAACDLVKAHRKFRPAIDSTGRRVVAAAETLVHFTHTRGEMPFAPMSPLPSSWLGTGPGRTTGWPPPRWSGDPARLTEPRFADFAPGGDKPNRLGVVGATMDFAADGRATRCEVRQTSGDPRFDAATCAALMTARNQAASSYLVRGYPVEVTWRGDDAELRLPTRPTLPRLAAPIAIPPNEALTAVAPLNLYVNVQLDPAGRVATCRLDGTSDYDAVDALACRTVMDNARFSAGRDVFGRPAVSGARLRVDWDKGEVTLPSY